MNPRHLSELDTTEYSLKQQDIKQYKRLTIDIPASLHRTIKSQCALRGSKIADEVRELLIEKYMKPVEDKNN